MGCVRTRDLWYSKSYVDHGGQYNSIAILKEIANMVAPRLLIFPGPPILPRSFITYKSFVFPGPSGPSRTHGPFGPSRLPEPFGPSRPPRTPRTPDPLDFLDLLDIYSICIPCCSYYVQ